MPKIYLMKTKNVFVNCIYDFNTDDKEDLIDFIKLHPDLNDTITEILEKCKSHCLSYYLNVCGVYPNQFIFFDIDTDFNTEAKTDLSRYIGKDNRIQFNFNYLGIENEN